MLVKRKWSRKNTIHGAPHKDDSCYTFRYRPIKETNVSTELTLVGQRDRINLLYWEIFDNS